MNGIPKLLAALAGCLWFILPATAQDASDISTEDYIATYKDLAEEEMVRTGVPASISLAQGILETNSGNGWLVLHSNNHFGIKCKSTWKGATVLYDDDRKQECFRKYKTAEDSWRDHSDFLRGSQRYAALFRLDPLDYKAWANGLKAAGYATSRTYPQQLMNIIDRYGLQQYSIEALALKAGVKNKAFADMLNKKVETDEEDLGYEKPAHPAPKPVKAARYPEGIFKINGKKVVYLPEGSFLIKTAEAHHIKLRRLVSYNELESDQPLPHAMLIYLQKKAKSGSEVMHVVQPGEDMHHIAQEEGIRLKWLYKRNKMEPGEEPAAGEKLYLQGYAP